MNGFYVSFVFLGVLLVAFSLVWIFLDKKKAFNFVKSFDKKKQELIEIISDAEEMIEELNKFSEYIVHTMDLKNEELNKNLKIAEKKVNSLSERANVTCNENSEMKPQESRESLVHREVVSNTDNDIAVALAKKIDNVIPIKNKYSEVIRLSKEGMKSLEIAKKLDMGKGETELILGIRK